MWGPTSTILRLTLFLFCVNLIFKRGRVYHEYAKNDKINNNLAVFSNSAETSKYGSRNLLTKAVKIKIILLFCLASSNFRSFQRLSEVLHKNQRKFNDLVSSKTEDELSSTDSTQSLNYIKFFRNRTSSYKIEIANALNSI